jgi:hypothetical protein
MIIDCLYIYSKKSSHPLLRHPEGFIIEYHFYFYFSLPCPSVGKDPRTYNYLGEEAVKVLEQEINYEMRMDYYRFLRRNKFKNGMMFTRATELYLEEHGMRELIPEETLLKSYFLWVKKVERK